MKLLTVLSFCVILFSACPKVSLDVAVGDAVSAITLQAQGLCEDEDGKCGSTANAQGYTVKLYYLYPYPTADNNGKRNYKAKIMITK